MIETKGSFNAKQKKAKPLYKNTSRSYFVYRLTVAAPNQYAWLLEQTKRLPKLKSVQMKHLMSQAKVARLKS